jgi:hypothetical protein
MSLARWVLEPESFWDGIAAQFESAPASAIHRALLTMVLGALVAAGAAELGARVFNIHWNVDLGVLTRPGGVFSPFAFTFAAALAWPLLLAALMGALLPLFRQPRRWRAALLVAVHGALPLYLTGATLMFFAATLLLLIAFVLSGFWWAAGARRLLGIGPRESAEFIGVTVLGAIILSQFVGAMLGGLM